MIPRVVELFRRNMDRLRAQADKPPAREPVDAETRLRRNGSGGLADQEMPGRAAPGGLRPDHDRPDPPRPEPVQRSLDKPSTERENLLRLAEMQDRGYKPPNLYVQITNHCNLRCAMCGHRTAIKDNAFMDRELFERVLDEAEASEVVQLIFAAAFGETLLHPDAFEYIAEAVRRGFKVILSTNGNYLTPEQIERLAAAGLYCIQYSFFGYDAPSYEKTYIRGEFAKACENLRLLKTAMVQIGASTQLIVNGINLYADAERTRKTREFLTSIGIEEHEIHVIAEQFRRSNQPWQPAEQHRGQIVQGRRQVAIAAVQTALIDARNNGRWAHDRVRLPRQ